MMQKIMRIERFLTRIERFTALIERFSLLIERFCRLIERFIQNKNIEHATIQCFYFRVRSSTVTISGKLNTLYGMTLLPRPRLTTIFVPSSS